jgi:hypothetical protein
MRRTLRAAAVAAVILATATGCPEGGKVCEPGEVREDSYQPGRYWQCNQDGTKESPLNAPGSPAPDPIEA